MTRYVQRISLLGRERWIGWEVDDLGAEVPGLVCAEEIPEDELRARGVDEFRPLPFETMLEFGSAMRGEDDLLDRDVEFRLDALQVGIDCCRDRGIDAVPLAALVRVFGSKRNIAHPRVQERLRQLQSAGRIEFVGDDECYLRIR
ncbi:MAG TPA: hypothetical protein VNL91_08650 [Thermoanaerobaculia bacterium]|nr:hypothetical protein [Thermoanaerobaculia bacterium]